MFRISRASWPLRPCWHDMGEISDHGMIRSQHSNAARDALGRQLFSGTFNLQRTQAQRDFLGLLRETSLAITTPSVIYGRNTNVIFIYICIYICMYVQWMLERYSNWYINNIYPASNIIIHLVITQKLCSNVNENSISKYCTKKN